MEQFLKKRGFLVKRFENLSLLKEIQKCIKKDFNKSTNYYSKLSLDDFRKICVRCQNKINKLNIQKRFKEGEKNFFKKNHINDIPLFETVIFLRAVRPHKKNIIPEPPMFHRETFYSNYSFMRHCVNIWIPVMNVNEKNTLKYIPKSHLIPDKKIKRRKINKKYVKVKKFSSGHKLGFFWAPKKIISGINLKKQRKINIPKNYYVLFSSMLVHGNAINYHNKIRFVIGFGYIPKSKMKRNQKFFFASKKAQFLSF